MNLLYSCREKRRKKQPILNNCFKLNSSILNNDFKFNIIIISLHAKLITSLKCKHDKSETYYYKLIKFGL